MRFLDSLLGRTRLPRPQTEQLFQLITVARFTVSSGVVSAGEAALCLKPLTTVGSRSRKRTARPSRLVAKATLRQNADR